MRIVIAHFFAIVLSTTLVFLVAVPEETLCVEPLSIIQGAVSAATTILRPFAVSYLDDLRATRKAEAVEVRVWMHTGDPKMNGCGFYFQAFGHSGDVKSELLPPNIRHACETGDRKTRNMYKYKMRMTSQSAMYHKSIHLGNDQVKAIELHADGWQDTMVKLLCFGLNERTIVSGPRAFCVNNNLLKACQGLDNETWTNMNFEAKEMNFTRTTRGIHKIIFRDIESLVNAFETLNNNPQDANAVTTLCNKIDLVKGNDQDDKRYCTAVKSWIEVTTGGMFFQETKYLDEDKNPYGCTRNERSD